ncbi:hypothetical protein RYZ26_15505 [Terasakiella sp. A23]|uniref:hypothetical protein n=1 Tax=Terasakiella sp. FCG-A23 TaxID=3080561 RepID=UPI002955C9AE|nr:hypothetical protein [Terasakiella sp. A23]MDV7341012.1 hypothetical protein [Terasakiella sp. A23]
MSDFNTSVLKEKPFSWKLSFYSFCLLISIGYASFYFWQGTRPIDVNQSNVLKAVVDDVAKAESRTVQGVWAEIHRTYGVRTLHDLKKNDYNDLMDRLARRLQK